MQLRGEWLHYYTAAWIDGTTLREHARREPERWLGPLADALEGLLALHDLGVVHGDFTPDNVLVEASGGGVLIDLGCARPRGQSSETIAGTPGFLAPELLASGTADVASDLYAVGVSLQQLAGGRPRRELSELISRLLAGDPSSDRTACAACSLRSATRGGGPQPSGAVAASGGARGRASSIRRLAHCARRRAQPSPRARPAG
jgi:serine/threonine protein kinase